VRRVVPVAAPFFGVVGSENVCRIDAVKRPGHSVKLCVERSCWPLVAGGAAIPSVVKDFAGRSSARSLRNQ